MANTILTSSILAKVALSHLENNLVFAKLVTRDYENSFQKVGDTISIRKPIKGNIADGPTISSVGDTTEGKTTLVLDKQKVSTFQFTSKEMTLSVDEMSERFIKPQMIRLANQIDQDLAALYANVWNYVGTPGTTLASWAALARGSQRLDEMAVTDSRNAVLSPADAYALAGSLTTQYVQKRAESALGEAQIGRLARADVFSGQNVASFTTGARGGTPLVNGASQNVTWATAKDSNSQSLITDGWSNSITGIVKAGDVFTIAGVYAVNPITKATLPYLQQFVVTADGTSSGAGALTMTISPAIIASGEYQTVSAAPADNAALTFVGSAATGYSQNMMFAKEAFALAVRPLDILPGSVDVARESYKGLSVRVWPTADWTNDLAKWRLDILYGVKAIYPDLACRMGG